MSECTNFNAFSDGANFYVKETGQAACFCTMIDRQCVDGRAATLCAPYWEEEWGRMETFDIYDDYFDGDQGPFHDTARFSDGTTTTFVSGLQACLGLSFCTPAEPPELEAGCSEGRGFYECDGVFVNLQGVAFSSYQQAVADCRIPAADF